MAWTNPRTWTTGESVSAAQLNTHLRDNLSFLAAPDRAMGNRGAFAQTLSTATWTEMVFGSENYDTGGMHTTGGDNQQFAAAVAGAYLCVAQVRFAANSTGDRKAMIRKNSAHGAGGGTAWGLTCVRAATGQETSFSIAAVVPLSAGDYVSAWAWQNSGGNLDLEAGAELNWMQVMRLGD